MYLTLLCVLVFASSGYGEDEKEVLDKVNDGIEAGNAIIEALGDESSSKTFGEIGMINAKIESFLGGIGPAVALISIFLPDSPSPELQYMKKKFAEMDQKFDKVFTEFGEVKNLILETSLKAQYGQYEHTISALSYRLQQFLSAPTDATEGQKATFITAYESTYTSLHTYTLWRGMMEETVLSDNIPKTAMEYTENHRRRVQKIMKGVTNLILQSLKLDLSYLKMKGRDATYADEKRTWEENIKQLTDHMQSVDQKVTSLWHVQVETDLKNKLALWNGQSHSDFADKFYDFLNDKYDWRYWHIVVYNELNEGKEHWMKYCGGYHSIRKHGRNIVMSSIDQAKEAVDIGHAKDLVLKDNIHVYEYAAAEWIYRELFPPELKNGCKYAATGLIYGGGNAQYRAPEDRSTFFQVGNFKVHVFG